MGYGGYGQKAEGAAGVIGQAAQGLGVVATAAGSVIQSGISYLGWKGAEQTPQQHSKMQGFGSETYSPHGFSSGSGSTAYNPPGGYSNYSESNQYNQLSFGNSEQLQTSQPKWGSRPPALKEDEVISKKESSP